MERRLFLKGAAAAPAARLPASADLRKKIYFSAVTPDLYPPMYRDKVVAFFDQLLDPRFADKPFIRHCRRS